MQQGLEELFKMVVINFLIIIPIALYAIVLIDKIIKEFYNNHQKEWEAAGKPSGMLYFPPETRNMHSMISMQIKLFGWFFKTPTWMKKNYKAHSYLQRFRILTVIINLLILGLMVYFFTTIIPLVT